MDYYDGDDDEDCAEEESSTLARRQTRNHIITQPHAQVRNTPLINSNGAGHVISSTRQMHLAITTEGYSP